MLVQQSGLAAGLASGQTGQLVGQDGSVGVNGGGGAAGISGGGVPAGTMVMHSADVRKPANVPIGWLPCDGRKLLKVAYPTLWSVIGDTYTNRTDVSVLPSEFNVPDMRGRYPAGVQPPGVQVDGLDFDQLGHKLAGRLQMTEVPYHDHYVNFGKILVGGRNYDLNQAKPWEESGYMEHSSGGTFMRKGGEYKVETCRLHGTPTVYENCASPWQNVYQLKAYPGMNLGEQEVARTAPPSLLVHFIIKT